MDGTRAGKIFVIPAANPLTRSRRQEFLAPALNRMLSWQGIVIGKLSSSLMKSEPRFPRTQSTSEECALTDSDFYVDDPGVLRGSRTSLLQRLQKLPKTYRFTLLTKRGLLLAGSTHAVRARRPLPRTCRSFENAQRTSKR